MDFLLRRSLVIRYRNLARRMYLRLLTLNCLSIFRRVHQRSSWGENEERNSPSNAMDILCDTKWTVDACYDDQNTPNRQDLSHKGEASDGSKYRTDCKV
ncbi:hypothetical protein K7X08_028440 [Anisodus acutangulus]|uniref:Uncharacterized protein n=1 Tax=Anisodus acutangulus TaxID=402998 RepID=A0A9Q1MAA0_9SOLA|nr:hypothetical protein K7X08_028440 [Anisodus acutangulus]